MNPGACEIVQCDYENSPEGTVELWFVADDDGTGRGIETECNEENNWMHISMICPGYEIVN